MAGLMLLTDSPTCSVSLTETGSRLGLGDASTGALVLADSGLALTLGDLP